jgi:2-polyprenyl-6-hydroxyphenyl methylase/3-demethylubiquinone-9 3-methyltransferase
MPSTAPDVAAAHAAEVRQGERFAFGRNWQHFLRTIDEERIAAATTALADMLEVTSLAGRRLLDIGSGSGLSSLAARRLGADVVSFDYDPQCVACGEELKSRFAPHDRQWTILHGSVLDQDFLGGLGKFDVVYSWGVLHQTGDMWTALENVGNLVQDGGKLFVSIYNDQGGKSRRWRAIKRLYCRSPQFVQTLLVLAVGGWWETRDFFVRLVRLQNPLPFADWAKRKNTRGMSVWHDLVDWVGGYPFEVARPEQVFDFFRARGFVLTRLRTGGGGHGCNEFVFQRAEGR